MTTSNRLGITELAETQNNRSVTVNEAIAKLEAGATFFAANQVLLNAPPGSPAEGDLYVVGTAGSGAWSGHSENIALYYNSAWLFFVPFEGMFAWDQTSNSLKRYDGADWVAYTASGGSVADADYGDITVSSSGAVWTIDNDVVTNAKAANMAQSTIKGRAASAGTGDPTDLTVAQVVTIIGDTDGTLAANSDSLVATQKATKTYVDASLGGGGGFVAASTTEVLTGTNTTKGATPDAIAALWEKGADVASSGTTSLGEGGYFHVTGTTTITDIDWATAKDGRVAWVIFDGILTLTHNATTLKLPGGANIITAAGDRACFVQDASDNVICLLYLRADGSPLNATILRSNATANLTAGYTATAYNAGTQTTGTLTPDPANGNIQRAVNGGAHTLAPPSVGGGDSLTMVIQYTNNGSAGTLTTSGFTKKTGDALTTVNGDDFLFHISVVNGFSHLNVVALQ